MGVAKKEFADVRMSMDYFQGLTEEIKSNMELRQVHVEGWQEEYQSNEEWRAQKALTDYKAYSKLKEIEYKIRHNHARQQAQTIEGSRTHSVCGC